MQEKQQQEKLPVGKNEDVEYRAEFADNDDVEAQQRAKEADRRQKSTM